MTQLDLNELNNCSKKKFIAELGGIYEHSPWVAKKVYSKRPFKTTRDLHATMKKLVNLAPEEKKIELLRAHPDLGEQTEMTEASQNEQASAGLDNLSEKEYKTFNRLNNNYKDKFDFPFIMAVKNQDPELIRDSMKERLSNTVEKEFQTALKEVHKIAWFRLDDLLGKSEQ